jgi:23S rRNA-/tRNA-specific pseudouridylate synthase
MIQIRDENEFFMVLSKPVGYSVHNQSPSVQEFLNKAKKPLHFVNRLDQETSGLIIVAKSAVFQGLITEALTEGQKFYRALLRGPWDKPTKDLLWSWPISDKAEGRANPKGVSADRKEAATQVQVLRSNKHFTEVYIELMTGRQHQIRKHAAIAKHPIVGDPRYNEKKYNDNIAKIYGQTRMQLHAEKIVFEMEGKTFSYEMPYNLNVFFEQKEAAEKKTEAKTKK